MEVRIIRSKKRWRTASARLVNGSLVIRAPAVLSQARLERIVAGFISKFEKKRLLAELEKKQDLSIIAAKLNEKYFGNTLKINSIEYVSDQNSLFGCCNYHSSNIRISHRIGLMPDWVRDYCLVHEMAHLIEPNHSKSFWDIVSRYKLAERARGFLLAKGLEGLEE
jgi:predicted metal-dependent hydrolase